MHPWLNWIACKKEDRPVDWVLTFSPKIAHFWCQRFLRSVAECFKLQVSSRIMNHCVGLDTNSHKAIVDWETFLKLYCIFEVGAVEHQKLISFWIKFFDIELSGLCPEDEYMDLLEKLVRGKCMKEKSEFTTLFAHSYQDAMQERGILDEDNSIVIERMQQAFENRTLDIN